MGERAGEAETERAASGSGSGLGTMTTERGDLPVVEADAFGAPWPETDRYALVRELARGGGGRIAVAMDLKLGRRIALKRPIDRDGSARLEREAMVMARLEHPSIVPIHDAGRDAEGPFYAMKLLGGPNLSERIREAETFEARLGLLRVVSAVCDAMAYAHARGVIHRDLKPANVVVGEFGEVAVIDWGLAKAVADVERTPGAETISAELTIDGAVMGTPAYMAPEQAAGGEVDARADVYALGAMLYQVLTGELPYGRLSSKEQLATLIEGPPPPVDEREPRVPAELAAIVGKAMARAPGDRYPGAGELAEDVHRYETGRLVAAHRYTRVMRARRWMRRHRGALAIAIATLASAGAIAFAMTRPAAAASTCVDLDRDVRAAWNDTARARIARAFAPSPGAVGAVTAALDERASRIAAMRREACVARETRAQSSEVVDDRMGCLDERTGELRAVAASRAQLAPAELERAPAALGALGSIDDCADTRRLRDAPLPTDRAARAEVLAVDERLTQLDAQNLIGSTQVVAAIAPSLIGRAAATGHGPLVARALLVTGEMLASLERTAEAEKLLGGAIVAAERAHDDARRGLAMNDLAVLALNERDKLDRAEELATQAQAIAERTGDARMLRGALDALAQVASAHGDGERAIAYARRVVELARAPDVPPITRAEAVGSLGKDLGVAGHLDDAEPLLEQAVRDIRAASSVPDRRDLGVLLQDLAEVALSRGRYAEAEARIVEANAMLARVVGADGDLVLSGRMTLATIYKMEDRYGDAERELLAVRDRLIAIASPSKTTLGAVYGQLGDVLHWEGRATDALAADDRAAALYASVDPGTINYAYTRLDAGSMRDELGRFAEAVPDLRAAAALFAKLEGDGGVDTAYARAELGKALAWSGHADEGAALLRGAIAGITAGGNVADVGASEYELARALWAAGDRDGSRAAAATARERLTAAGAEGAKSLAQLDAWTAAHLR
jgi:tetratricopeptide (TPR) repeat protein